MVGAPAFAPANHDHSNRKEQNEITRTATIRYNVPFHSYHPIQCVKNYFRKNENVHEK